ncbi:hypothetical protein MHYP_G00178580 [Metynnis hypsauchen]
MQSEADPAVKNVKQISPHSVNRAGGGRRNRRVLCAQLTLRTLGAFRKKRPSEFKWRDKRERPGNPHEVRQGYFQAN